MIDSVLAICRIHLSTLTYYIMPDKEIPRLSRLLALITQLQSKRLLTSTELSGRFGVSVRTIYRDMKALEQAGVPILIEEGRGYSLSESFRLPPVMFTDDEANALVTAEKLVLVNKDVSLIKNYGMAVSKIKSVMESTAKDKVELLSKRVGFWQNPQHIDDASNLLSSIQIALTNLCVIQLEYHSKNSDKITQRDVEPFAVINKLGESWFLIGWCRTRKDYRMFRLDRIRNLKITDNKFKPHKISLGEYLDNYRKNTFGHP